MISLNLVMELIFINPEKTLPITLTGNFCALNCPHCAGHYLRSMKSFDRIEDYVAAGYKSFLISGGLNNVGELPLDGYLNRLAEMKQKYNLKYNFHIGFPSRLDSLAGLADVVSFDFFASRQILRNIYRIDYDPMKLIELLKQTDLPSVPHITIGISCGNISHEYSALRILRNHYDAVVLNVFVPTPGTLYEKCPPPSIDDVAKVFAFARSLFKTVVLGCMQPRGEYRKKLQQTIYDYVNVIVKPVEKVSVDYQGCCAFLLVNKNLEVFNNVRQRRNAEVE